jgi:hypothetical protein
MEDETKPTKATAKQS